jgi:WhiB family redox-sensing transcriptional regulator
MMLNAEPVLDRDVYVASMRWRAQARCRGVDTEVFFPARGDNLSAHVAKRIRRACPVRAECLDYALEAGEKVGLWGGVSERQRARLRPSGSNQVSILATSS